MTWVWRQRSPLYLLGVAGLVVATLGYTVAHVAPFWVRLEGQQNRSPVNIGLWFFCLDDSSCASSNSFTFDQDSVKATRILQVLGLLILVTSVATAIFANCRRQHPGSSFFLEAVTVLGSVLGFSGSMVYLAATLEDVRDSGLTRYDWAFALSVAASLLALLSAILVFIANIRSVLGDQGGGGSGLQNAAELVKSHGDPPASDAEARSDNDPYFTEVYPPGAPGEPPSFVEPPMDYHHDPAVYSTREPASLPPMTDRPFPPEHGRHGGPRSDLYPGKGWRKMKMKLPPPPSRRPHDEYGHMAVGRQPIGVAARHGRYPLGMGPPAGAFVLPRVIVRGHYEQGYGYPEYTMF